jgi:hypothetical protein
VALEAGKVSTQKEHLMDTTHTQHTHPEQDTPQTTASPAPEKHSWQEPKLAFVEPKLTPHGELQKVTGGFFGTFTP